jgi:flagellar motor protein MotB
MAGKGGGGAWKVAYADFVTALMAFFLVMWICGQDQSIKRAVAYYFQDPFSASDVGTSSSPERKGSVVEFHSPGTVPAAEKVAVGRGRSTYTQANYKSLATKLVSDWLFSDQEASDRWHDQATRRREQARWAPDVVSKRVSIDSVATQMLAKDLETEIPRGFPAQTSRLYKDLFHEVIADVNWTEIAQDLLAHE